MTIKAPKKLIEVALPLDDINAAAAKEKSIRHGHPSTLHLWWARRPLAAARAVLFAQLVNDPGGERGWGRTSGQTKEDAQREREALFDIIRDLVKWENTTNEKVLDRARHAIRKSWAETCALNAGKPGFDPERLPAFHDPFAGGGAIPLEAQRLGLEAYASDLNPVAVMINKAMIEIPPKFAGRPPVNPHARAGTTPYERSWEGAEGLAEDVRYYGRWMRDRAFERIGHLYPQVEITPQMAAGRDDLRGLTGQKLTVIAWLWARTVQSPNPAFSHVAVPLVKSFVLSSKTAKGAWVEPVVDGDCYRFEIRTGHLPKTAAEGTKLARGANFRCILSDTPIEPKHIKAEGVAGRMGQRLMAVVAEGRKGRIYLPPDEAMEAVAVSARPMWSPKGAVPKKLTGGTCYGYGLDEWGKLFTPRQLVALTTFSDLVLEAREEAIAHAKAAGMVDDGVGLNAGGGGATAYGDAVAVYLAMAVSKLSDAQSSLVRWKPTMDQAIGTFGRQALPMVYDFAESNVFNLMAGDYLVSLSNMMRVLNKSICCGTGKSEQANAIAQKISSEKVLSTDPPYYDNVGYADLSDYFYVWLRRSVKTIFKDIFATMTVPKTEELIASPYRQGSKKSAESFFLNGMREAIKNLAIQANDAFPVTIYYAFKQDANTASTGWETFLVAIIQAGFSITGTWPMRTELGNRMIGMGTNALASSIVLVCRKRPADAPTISRRDFQRELKTTMPEALEAMIGGREGASPIAPVDLAQAAIGPGMAVFSRYAAVLEADGSAMGVHAALVQINREIDDYFHAAEGDLDAESRFCIDWFQEYGFKSGPFGQADVLARAKGTGVGAVEAAGVVVSGSGKVRLLTFGDYPVDWNPDQDPRIPVWEATHQLMRALKSGDEQTSGALLARMPGKAEPIRQLAYRLYTLCERKGWAEEARAYNELICAWRGIVAASEKAGVKGTQMRIDEGL
jgi:putative DNA methylase